VCFQAPGTLKIASLCKLIDDAIKWFKKKDPSRFYELIKDKKKEEKMAKYQPTKQ